jgi:transposase
MAVKYVVTLTPEERERLTDLSTKGTAAAATLTHARILLKADAAAGGPNWSDAQIAEALDTSPATIHRVRQAFVTEGLDTALQRRRPTGRTFRKLDGAQEAQLIAVACSAPPAGRARWTLQLLADRLVELEVVDAISPECVRTTLKKTTSSPG